MNDQDLTEKINDRIGDLKKEVKQLPAGGGLEILKINQIEHSVTGLNSV